MLCKTPKNPIKSGKSCPWEAVGPRGPKGSLVAAIAPPQFGSSYSPPGPGGRHFQAGAVELGVSLQSNPPLWPPASHHNKGQQQRRACAVASGSYQWYQICSNLTCCVFNGTVPAQSRDTAGSDLACNLRSSRHHLCPVANHSALCNSASTPLVPPPISRIIRPRNNHSLRT
jgi:hypothetical protein